jgi:tRNA threonylcarbamoyladenosine biosynthesis protein TsaE
MGAGKTTLCQSIIHELGYSGSVTSPTYNLIHEYPVKEGVVYHLDLYRLEDPAELEYLAIGDLWQNDSVFLVEWPNIGQGHLPQAGYYISIDSEKSGDENHRTVKFLEVLC